MVVLIFTRKRSVGITESLVGNNPNPTENDILVEEVEVDNTAWNLRMNNSFTVTKKTYDATIWFLSWTE